MTTPPSAVVDHAAHTAYTRPGLHADLLAVLPTEVGELSEVARNVIVHYRTNEHTLPESSFDDINLRWVERMLETDQARHGRPLSEPREATDRLQGCCRDHTLFCVAALRTHGIPARSRVGFSGYFTPGFHHDHVVVEAWLDGRWQRFDSEIGPGFEAMPSPTDMPAAEIDSTGFVTAAQAWQGHRAGDLDPLTYGVHPDVPILQGERFLFDEVIYEVAHRFGDELLLWDGWGRMEAPGTPVTEADAAWADEIAALLLAADAGDLDAERRLLDRYRTDPGLHPGTTVSQASPRGDEPVRVALHR